LRWEGSTEGICNQFKINPNDIVNDTVNDTVNDAVNDTVNDTVNNPLNHPLNDIVVYWIRKKNTITALEMSELLQVSLSTIRRKLKKLKEKGVIERVGSDKTGYWKITETSE
jgi:predicted HTH transcriptional regulator